ncbi:MAG: formate--tetrahydrofolate ligase [Pseudomonadota bacterium]|nr:formate--tetrahydrofolate ligase [Pseudomonadota bacterium]
MSRTYQQHTNPKTDLEIARNADYVPITELASSKLNLDPSQLINFGNNKAKIKLDAGKTQEQRATGKLVLVTAITPTPAGEGKTTTTVGLGDALQKIGVRAAICLREPSLGPCFGMKGGAAGGGYAQIIPMEDINLHFTGDFHAISAANNLLAAMVDNHVYWGNQSQLDTRRITWRRVVDMNDRALREIVLGLGGVSNGFAHSGNFDITVASEVMAILCLAESLDELGSRLGQIIVGSDLNKRFVKASQLNANGAMTALLKDAFLPNLVQSLEGTPALVHGGPFANIAHGCNSLIATKTALKLADYVVTEAGFGADLGAEKFFNIKCRQSNLEPDCAVLVATVRALKMHGGVERSKLQKEDIRALKRGSDNLARHVNNIRKFNVPVVVALNRFTSDTQKELETLKDCCTSIGVEIAECDHWATGGAGATDLAQKVVSTINNKPSEFQLLYEDDAPLKSKIETIATEIYGAESITIEPAADRKLGELQNENFGSLPICVAKTPYSFSSDPNLKGAPTGHDLKIRDIRLSAGAGFIVAVCGEIMTMPGLPSRPAAADIQLDKEGRICGLF